MAKISYQILSDSIITIMVVDDDGVTMPPIYNKNKPPFLIDLCMLCNGNIASSYIAPPPIL